MLSSSLFLSIGSWLCCQPSAESIVVCHPVLRAAVVDSTEQSRMMSRTPCCFSLMVTNLLISIQISFRQVDQSHSLEPNDLHAHNWADAGCDSLCSLTGFLYYMQILNQLKQRWLSSVKLLPPHMHGRVSTFLTHGHTVVVCAVKLWITITSFPCCVLQIMHLTKQHPWSMSRYRRLWEVSAWYVLECMHSLVRPTKDVIYIFSPHTPLLL